MNQIYLYCSVSILTLAGVTFFQLEEFTLYHAVAGQTPELTSLEKLVFKTKNILRKTF